MKIRLHLDDVEWHCTQPHAGADRVEAAAPACRCGSVCVRGTGDDVRGHDTVETRAVCTGCGEPRGRIVVTFSTIFGIAADAETLSGKYGRVY